MPSMKHEAPLLLLRNRPQLAADLVRTVLGVPLPSFTEAQLEAGTFNEVKPAQYDADLVVRLCEGGRTVFAIIVEVQLSPDSDKRWTWPLYLASLRARLKCPVVLLVHTPDAALVGWCAEPIDLGHPSLVLRPLVLGPDQVPTVSDEAEAKADPELAVFSAMSHGGDPGAAERAVAILGAVRQLDEERSRLYHDLVMAALSDAARKTLEAIVNSGTYEYQSEFARKYVAQGKAEGKAEGEAKGKAEALLVILDTRGLSVSEAQREHISSCTDLGELERFLRRAISAVSIEEVLG